MKTIGIVLVLGIMCIFQYQQASKIKYLESRVADYEIIIPVLQFSTDVLLELQTKEMIKEVERLEEELGSNRESLLDLEGFNQSGT